MTHKLRTLTLLLLALSIGAAGCGHSGSAPTTRSSEPEFGWEEAKAAAQETSMELAELLPKSHVVSVTQSPTGILLSCGRDLHQWTGYTFVELHKRTDVEGAVKVIESRVSKNQFDVWSGRSELGSYTIQLSSIRTGAVFVIMRGVEPEVIRIRAASKCFSLPDGELPVGRF